MQLIKSGFGTDLSFFLNINPTSQIIAPVYSVELGLVWYPTQMNYQVSDSNQIPPKGLILNQRIQMVDIKNLNIVNNKTFDCKYVCKQIAEKLDLASYFKKFGFDYMENKLA